MSATLVANDLDFSRSAILNIETIAGSELAPLTISQSSPQVVAINTATDSGLAINLDGTSTLEAFVGGLINLNSDATITLQGNELELNSAGDINLTPGVTGFINANAVINATGIENMAGGPLTLTSTNENLNLFSNGVGSVILNASGSGHVQAYGNTFSVISPSGIFGNLSTTSNSMNIAVQGGGNNNINLLPAGTGLVNMIGPIGMVNASAITVGTISVNSSYMFLNTTSGFNLELNAQGAGNLNLNGNTANLSSTGTNANLKIAANGTGVINVYGTMTMLTTAGAGSATMGGDASGNISMFGAVARMNGVSVASGTNTLLGNSSADITIQAPTGNRNVNLNATGTGVVNLNANLQFAAGGKINIPTGSNSSVGVTSAMTGSPGSVTVSSTNVTTNSIIIYSRKTTGGTAGQVSISAQSAGSFTLTSTSAETSTFNYWIIN